MSRKNDKEPESVNRHSEFVIAHKPQIDVTKVTDKEGNTYTGYGWSQEEADRNAGEKFSDGKKDKK